MYFLDLHHSLNPAIINSSFLLHIVIYSDLRLLHLHIFHCNKISSTHTSKSPYISLTYPTSNLFILSKTLLNFGIPTNLPSPKLTHKQIKCPLEIQTTKDGMQPQGNGIP